jgi:phage/plasmid-associated DNA primase
LTPRSASTVFIGDDFNGDEELAGWINAALEHPKVREVARIIAAVNKDHFASANGKVFYCDPQTSLWRLDGNDGQGLELKDVGIEKAINVVKSLVALVETEPEKFGGKVEKALSKIRDIMSSNTSELMRLAESFLLDRNLASQLGALRNFLPFRNGVFDIPTRTFRPIKRDDYILEKGTIPYDYDPTAQSDGLESFLHLFQRDQKCLDFLLKIVSNSLDLNAVKDFILALLGDGHNAKSQFFTLVETTLGPRARKIDESLFTGKRPSAQSANEAKMDLQKRRFAFFSEPDNGTFNVPAIKDLVSNETQTGRKNYGSQTTFRIVAQFMMGLNAWPDVPDAAQRAFWTRIRALACLSWFNDNPDPNDQNQFKKDPSIVQKVQSVEWAQAFMNILISYLDKDVPTPHVVEDLTNRVRAEQDRLLQFIESRMEFGESFKVRAKAVHEAYKAWHRETHGTAPAEGDSCKKLAVPVENKLVGLNRGVSKDKSSRMVFQGVRLVVAAPTVTASALRPSGKGLVSGEGKAGATITLYDGSVVVGSGVVDA